MTDTVEAVALRLFQFILDAHNEARLAGFQTQVRTTMASSTDKAPILKTYEECLKSLTDSERFELNRMIQKMSGALRSPPSAITPP